MFEKIKNLISGSRQASAQDHVPPNRADAPAGPWFGVDLDGTLAVWDSTSSLDSVGDAVPAMLNLVKKMLENGIRVKIFTARAQDSEQRDLIRQWLKKNGLPELEITNVKDYYMQRLYDDRCIRVERNTGRLIKDEKS